jgi:integrase
MAEKRKRQRYFGTTRTLSSGRVQARYYGPDGVRYSAVTPEGRPLTFDSKGDADAWLALRRSEILRGAWLPPDQEVTAPVTLATYASAWLAQRELRPRSRSDYGRLLRDHILPTFGRLPVTSITPAAVRMWHAALVPGRPTLRARAYGLLRTICNTAIADEIINANPCRVRGGGQVKRKKKIKPATLPELEKLVSAMPERYRPMVLLAAWCALRFGELTELRRHDVNVTKGVLHVRRGVTHPDGTCAIGDPKSEAGKRDVAIPPHLVPLVKTHLAEHVEPGPDSLLFPPTMGGCHLLPSSLYRAFYPARQAAGRPDLRFHDLRHTGATLAAAAGATLAELMARLGHSTSGAALRYQHAAADRDRVIAQALSELAKGTAAPVRADQKPAKAKKTKKAKTKPGNDKTPTTKPNHAA